MSILIYVRENSLPINAEYSNIAALHKHTFSQLLRGNRNCVWNTRTLEGYGTYNHIIRRRKDKER